MAIWMKRLLWFVGGYNILAGVTMLCFYHESFKVMGVAKPQMNLPIQLVGMLVGLFGIGYWLVAANPAENRNLLVLGFWSKLLGSALGVYYVAAGKLPLAFLAVLFVSDVAYLPPFYLIMRRLARLAAEREALLAQAAELTSPASGRAAAWGTPSMAFRARLAGGRNAVGKSQSRLPKDE
jgi:hypothetical protein